jgi:hypothetical protein
VVEFSNELCERDLSIDDTSVCDGWGHGINGPVRRAFINGPVMDGETEPKEAKFCSFVHYLGLRNQKTQGRSSPKFFRSMHKGNLKF